MYVIAGVIFGIDLSAHNPEVASFVKQNKDHIEDMVEANILNTRYSGNNLKPVFFGVEIMQLCEGETIMVGSIPQVATADMMNQYEEKLYQALKSGLLNEQLSNKLSYAPRELFITWWTS